MSRTSMVWHTITLCQLYNYADGWQLVYTIYLAFGYSYVYFHLS